MKRRIFAAVAAATFGAVGLVGTASADSSGNTGCPQGGDWFLIFAVGDEFKWDNNGDGLICNKIIKGEGKGNSPFADQWLVKDNNNPVS